MKDHASRKTYTLINHMSGEVEQRGVSTMDAAETLLMHDGNQFEIRPEPDGGFGLYTSRFSRNSSCFDGLTRSVIYSSSELLQTATAEIYQKVVECGFWERPTIMSDSSYDSMSMNNADCETEN